MTKLFIILSLILCSMPAKAQDFLLGADLSYINEMEDCGALYKEMGFVKNPFTIFADHGCELVRLRLWHTPSWYDELNEGKRYSDLEDVRKSIRRAKERGMEVLLDFHLSDNWADPSKQLVPKAWLDVVDDLPVLQDSLSNYITQTLLSLHSDNLLPDWVQIGNETNKGILLSPSDNANWTLDWPRNATLFNTAIQAVREVEQETGKEVMIALHIAGPDGVEFMMDGFINNGVQDFDVIGISYYWQWHQPITITGAAEIIRGLRQKYPDKEVMILETGYPWTTANFDSANNILNDTFTGFSPASPAAQQAWLVELTKAMIESGAKGVLYWEPAWISTPCSTQWGKGSHGENASFFDETNNLIKDGGIGWLNYNYGPVTSEKKLDQSDLLIKYQLTSDLLRLNISPTLFHQDLSLVIYNALGQELSRSRIRPSALEYDIDISTLTAGSYILQIYDQNRRLQIIEWLIP